MNLNQFKLLDMQAQSAIISNKGVYITTIEISQYTIDLYQLENFYVKVIYSKTTDEITFTSYYSVYDKKLKGDDEWSLKYFHETLSKIAYL